MVAKPKKYKPPYPYSEDDDDDVLGKITKISSLRPGEWAVEDKGTTAFRHITEINSALLGGWWLKCGPPEAEGCRPYHETMICNHVKQVLIHRLDVQGNMAGNIVIPIDPNREQPIQRWANVYIEDEEIWFSAQARTLPAQISLPQIRKTGKPTVRLSIGLRQPSDGRMEIRKLLLTTLNYLKPRVSACFRCTRSDEDMKLFDVLCVLRTGRCLPCWKYENSGDTDNHDDDLIPDI